MDIGQIGINTTLTEDIWTEALVLQLMPTILVGEKR